MSSTPLSDSAAGFAVFAGRFPAPFAASGSATPPLNLRSPSPPHAPRDDGPTPFDVDLPSADADTDISGWGMHGLDDGSRACQQQHHHLPSCTDGIDDDDGSSAAPAGCAPFLIMHQDDAQISTNPAGLPPPFDSRCHHGDSRLGVSAAGLPDLSTSSYFPAAEASDSGLLGAADCFSDDFTQVTDSIYIGRQRCVTNEAAVRAAGITGLVCVAGELAQPFPAYATAAGSGMATHHAKLVDGPETQLATAVPPVLREIDAMVAEGRRVAVYCQQGKSRSAAVVMMLMMRQDGCTAEVALERLRAVYPRAEPCVAFLVELGEISVA